MIANRAIYHEGWTAVAKHKDPWLGSSHGVQEDVWELYHVEEDWTQSNDVAAEHPDKLAELQTLFLIQAARFNVLPLDTRSAERFNSELVGRPTLIKGTSQTLYPGMTRLKEDSVVVLKNKSHAVTAAIDVPEGGGQGVLIAQGGTYGGWSVYVTEGRLAYCYNVLGIERYKVVSESALPGGAQAVRVTFAYDGGGLGKGGTVTLFTGETQIGEGRVERTLPFMFSMDETLDVGSDLASPVSDDYGPSDNRFNGTIEWIKLDGGDDDHDHLVDPAHKMHIAMVRQ
jgi:arylsulfatase